MNWETVTAIDIGARKEQQDRVAVFRDSGKNAPCLLVLADGMGGQAGGSLAAQAIIDTAATIWSERSPSDPSKMLQRICMESHQAIRTVGLARGIVPRSTCVLLYLTQSRAYWLHIGDSRLYYFRGTRFLGRTLDHSVPQLLVQMGKLREEEMASHPDQKRLYKSLGGDDKPEPEEGEAVLSSRDGFFLCSDGLWEEMATPEIAQALMAKNLTTVIQQMVKQAIERGGSTSDNTAVAVARPSSFLYRWNARWARLVVRLTRRNNFS